jgi:serine/threonine protein phosphatase PrpC
MRDAEPAVRRERSFTLEFGVKRVIGCRNYQEDEFTCIDKWSDAGQYAFFGVYDGHGSDVFAAHASRHMHELVINSEKFKQGDVPGALVDAFAQEDRELEKKHEKGKHGGCTATAAVIAGGVLRVANVGDSRSVMGLQQHGQSLRAFRLSRDHKPEDPDEKERIEEVGGVVARGRVRGDTSAINMSRALGDHEFKQPRNEADGDFITWVPHISPAIPIDSTCRFLIVASDGLWSVFHDQEIVDLVGRMLEEGHSPEAICGMATATCEKHPHADNTTMVLVLFKHGETAADPKRPKISGKDEPGASIAERQ